MGAPSKLRLGGSFVGLATDSRITFVPKQFYRLRANVRRDLAGVGRALLSCKRPQCV